MLSYLRKRWNYLVAKLSGRFEENADPKVQLEQAITDARQQHRQLRDQAANVIANQKQTELRLNRKIEELEKVNGNARQAVLMAETAQADGDDAKVESYTNAAESFAGRLISLEEEIEDLKTLHYQAAEAADQAKAAVTQNSTALQKKISERQALLSQLDQAKMQESVNTAMATLGEAVGEEGPSFEQVRAKIEARYSKAKAVAELGEGNVESRMLEVEEAARNVAATERLSEIKRDLGIDAGPEPEAITEGDDSPA